MHAGGGREEFNDFLLDGADNNDPYVNRYGVEPPVDSIQGSRLPPAATVRNTAGRSWASERHHPPGTNNFHGSAYEYLRNKVLDARNFLTDPQTQSHSQSIRIERWRPSSAKDFFFVATDFLRSREGQSQLATVPTLDERGGNLSVLCQTGFTNGVCNAVPPNSNLSAVQIYDPSLSSRFRETSFLRTAFPSLPRTSCNSIQSQSPGGRWKLSGEPSLDENDTQGTFRLDHHLSPLVP